MAQFGRLTQAVNVFRQAPHHRQARRRVLSSCWRERAGGTIVMACAVGDTLVEGAALLHVHGSGTPLPEDALRRAVRLERERTFEQDPKYPIRLLVDIAIKALSPAINDPTTAVQTIDQLEDLLRRLGAAELDARPCRRRERRSPAGLPDADLGGLSHSRIRRDPALRLEFRSSDAADEVRSGRPRGLAAEPRTGGGGATISRAPRPSSSKPRRSTSRTRGWRAKRTGRGLACLGGNRTRPEPLGSSKAQSSEATGIRPSRIPLTKPR